MEALSRLERGLEEQAQARALTDVTVHDLYATVVETRSDLIKTVEYVYSVCSQLIERAESARLERQILIDTVKELARPSTIELSPSGERVLGGSFPASPDETVDVGVETEHRQSHWA